MLLAHQGMCPSSLNETSEGCFVNEGTMAISARASLGQYIISTPPSSVTLHTEWSVALPGCSV